MGFRTEKQKPYRRCSMKLEELRTGDIIIMRNADMGMVQVRGPEIYLLYLDTGFKYKHSYALLPD